MATVTDNDTKSVEPSTIPASPAGPTVYKGRWGYHACDYATFLEIKAFHKLLFRDLRATRRLRRWEAKLPHNRVRRHKDGTVDAIPEPKCVETEREYYEWVLAEYRLARKPMANAEEVTPLEMPKKWQSRHDKLKAFYGAG